MPHRSTLVVVLLAVLVMGCERVQEIREQWRPPHLHGQYAQMLSNAGLDDTALGKAWLTTASQLLNEGIPLTLPFHEVGYLNPSKATGVAYRLELKRGRQLEVFAQPETDDGLLFIDLFEVPPHASGPYRRVASADSTLRLSFEVTRTSTYLLRLQPELLTGGRYAVTLEETASIIFPVSGKDSGDIRSFFGADRDGGHRRHHGVDIFAPRGTPVVAAVDGRITRVRNGGLGGKVVWLRGHARGEHYYYAHLDSQMVRSNTYVQAGDTLGLVGNTGNARTTPPHLHFGIYQNGPHDPFPYVFLPDERPQALQVDTTQLARWARIQQRQAPLYASPSSHTEAHQQLPQHTVFQILGASARWYRIRLPDETQGYIAASTLEPSHAPLRQLQLTAGRSLQDRPMPTAPRVDTLTVDHTLDVLGTFGGYLKVATPDGRTGWIVADTP